MRSQENSGIRKLDLRIETKYKIFKRNNDISGVIHFAASKAVGESVENPLYYENNVSALVYVLQELQKMTEANFILVHLALFTVKPPITEDDSKKSDVSLWKYQAN
jgi:UDP-glucose 4-epimerase